MSESTASASDRLLALGDRIRVLPIVHGSADHALAVRDELLRRDYDCVAVTLPPSFEFDVMEAVGRLPVISAVVQQADDDGQVASYVPIDPCQPVIRGLRMAQAERRSVAFIDLEHRQPEVGEVVYPDAYALKTLAPEKFAAAIVPMLTAPDAESLRDRRIRHWAFELGKLTLDHQRILFLPAVVDWPFVREAFLRRAPYPENKPYFSPIATWGVAPASLFFFLAELPYITALYEKVRFSFDEETNQGIDGTKELLLEARDRLCARKASASRRLSLKTLDILLRYVRNLTLLSRRLRPELVTLVESCRQVTGDDFAIEVLETAKLYPFGEDDDRPKLRMGIGEAELPDLGRTRMISRLPGSLIEWRTIDLKREPDEPEQRRWRQVWNPLQQCSWPPEDRRIESFNLHVRDQAKSLISSDLARTEKFGSSLKDGLDIRETLRNWHTGDLYVRELPPARGSLEVVVFLFDVPADPNRYTWRSTWFAEHHEESTLAFFATSFMDDLVGPGIGQARYGGAFFLYPPRAIVDVWRDPRLADCTTLEERLLAGAFLNSRERYVAVVSPCPIKASWRRLARRFSKQAVHLPLTRFSASVVERLRTFHVLNGKEIRSYAARFIRGTE